MNLVAKEYVAAQNPLDPGVLVLSRFAGAAQQMAEALIVNPYDTADVAEALQRALQMPLEERIERWKALNATLREGSARRWCTLFLDALEETHAQQRLDLIDTDSGASGDPQVVKIRPRQLPSPAAPKRPPPESSPSAATLVRH